jgi:predicted acylesterase/phospholipase RssA
VAYAGAVDELVRLGIVDLERVTTFAGTSVGAVVACLLCIGCPPADLLATASSLDMNQFLNINLSTLMYQWGLDDGTRVRQFVEAQLLLRTGKADLTLGELLRTRGRNLRVCSSNMTLNRPAYFCGESEPDVPVVDAILMSIAIPPVFCPVRFRECVYIDGAFLDSFPVGGLDPASTLGLRLRWDVACSLDSIEQFYSRLAYCALSNAERSHAATEGYDVVEIAAGDVSTVNFALPRWNIAKLIDNGRDGVARFVLREPPARTPCSGAPVAPSESGRASPTGGSAPAESGP